MKKVIVLCFLFLCFFSVVVKAEEQQEMITEQIEKLPLYDVDRQIKEIWKKGDLPSFRECIQQSIEKGNFIDIKALFSWILKKMAGEMTTQISMIKKIFFVVLLSAILKNINSSFQGKSVGELGFYVCYMVLVVVMTATFYRQADMVGKTIKDVETFFKAMMPVFMTLSIASGSYETVTASVTMTGAGILTNIVCNIVLPAIIMMVSLEMINNISEKPMLSHFTKLFQEGIAWGMKGIAFLFMALLSIQKLGGNIVNQGLGKTAKAVVTAVPVVGDVMGGAVDTAAALTGMIRGGTLLTTVIFLVLLCAVPFIRLAIMILLYKVTAALAEPICETRLVKCISSAGDFSALLLGALFLAECMFLFSSILLLTFF